MLKNVGDNIRKIRKSKKLTLKEVSDGIFSIAKLSYIEKGITSITQEELEQICIKLNIKPEDILTEDLEAFEKDFKHKVSYIEDMIYFGIAEDIDKELLELKDLLESCNQKYKYNEFYLYLKAEHLYKKKDFNHSKILLESLITSKNNFEPIKKLKIISLIFLSKIHFEQRIYQIALEYAQKALHDSQKFSVKDSRFIEIIHYNLVHLYLWQGDFNIANIYLNRINTNDSPKYQYFKGLVNLYAGNYSEAEKFFAMSKNNFKKHNNTEMYFKNMIVLFYINQFEKQKSTFLPIKLENLIKSVLKTESLITPTFLRNTEFLSILHQIIILALKENDLDTARTYLERVTTLDDRSNDQIHVQTLYLNAKYLQLSKHENKEEIVGFYQKALELAKSSSACKAIILHELAILSTNEFSLFKEASQEFYSTYINKYNNILDPSYFLPRYEIINISYLLE